MSEQPTNSEILETIKNKILNYNHYYSRTNKAWFKFLKSICNSLKDSDLEVFEFKTNAVTKIKKLAFEARRYYQYTNGSGKTYMDKVMELDTQMLGIYDYNLLYCPNLRKFSWLEKGLVEYCMELLGYKSYDLSDTTMSREKEKLLAERLEYKYKITNEVSLFNHNQTLSRISFSNTEILDSTPIPLQKTFVFLKIHHKEKEYKLRVGHFNENNEFVYTGWDPLPLYNNSGRWVRTDVSLFNKIKFKE